MTFGPNHYVPVLKVKRGEKSALNLLPSSVAKEVTPLLEIVERTDKEKSLENHLRLVPQYLIPPGPAQLNRTTVLICI
jgi:hypothetical protein